MNKSMVYLVGAGPGNKKLLSVRALELIQKADVIIYDRLANSDILEEAKEGCDLVYVGKGPNQHTFRQEEINDILLEKAKNNHIVVRLKGGDPYIFGRGGEEAEVLYDHNIPFEVAPGIPSFSAACSYGGIPVTFRNQAASFHVFTGHFCKEQTLAYPVIAKLEGTLFFLMAMQHNQEIAKGLIAAGKNPATPAAMVQWGTTAKQRQIYGTLDTISALAEKEGIGNPAIFVIGEVAAMADKLFWLGRKPLYGKKVLLTREREKAGKLAAILEEEGAAVTGIPTTKIVLPAESTALDQELQRIENYQWLLFSSKNGVEAFFQRMAALKVDIRKIARCQVFCIGEKTKETLAQRGICDTVCPKQYDSVAGSAALKGFLDPGERILHPTSQLAGDEFRLAAQEKRCHYTKVTAYRTEQTERISERDMDHIKNGYFDAALFFSASQAEQFFRQVEGESAAMKYCALGQKTAQAIERAGRKVAAVAENATEEKFAAAVTELLRFQ